MESPERLFCSDLDGTLIDPEGASPSALARLHELLGPGSRIAVAYVTGRHFEHALAGIEGAGLMRPDHLATSVGTRLDRWDGARWTPDPDYAAALADRIGAVGLEEVDAIALAVEGVRPQPPVRCSAFKRSFFVDPGIDPAAVATVVRERFAARGGRAAIIASVDPVTGEGLLDVLPPGTSKLTAVAHLQERLGLADADVVFCGDSGNDVAGLRGPWQGILVGNAQEQVRSAVAAPGREGAATRTVLARARTLEGVLEGLRALGWT